MKVFLLMFFLALSTMSYSQSPKALSPFEYTVKGIDDRKVELQFHSDSVIHDLLIVVTDKNGQTIFLDRQHKFKGTYKQEIDLNGSDKGSYSFLVMRGNEEYVKTFNIK